MMNNLGIYLHIPFCKSKCAYCDFYSLCDYAYAEKYVEQLEKQMRAWGNHARTALCDTVYIGGGTPTSIGLELLGRVISSVKDHFHLSKDCEFTIEANPGTVDKKALESYRKAGVNRISFGVQSADDGLLRRIGRIHSFDEAKDAILMANSEGFENVSADLMYALPEQSVDDLLFSIEMLSTLPLTHISMYGLKVEPNTPFGRNANLALPDEDVQCEMYLKGVEALRSHGFLQYEISNFSLPGFESRHNLKYWTGASYIGLGCAAHSYFDGRRFCAPSSLKDFCACDDFSKGSSFYSGSEISEKEAEREEVMLALRTVKGINIQKLYGYCKGNAGAYIADLVRHGYGSLCNDNFYLTPVGMLVSNAVIGQFFEFMEQ